jgi:acyl carrier protein
LADRLIVNQEWRLFEEVFAPKVEGAWNLHWLTRDMPLDFFVLFSSASTILGGSGQANYVAANEFLDALASYRRRIGLPGLSIDWGPWADVGMAKLVGRRREAEWEAIGMCPLAPPDAVRALSLVLGSGRAQLGVIDLNWTRFLCHPASAVLGRFLGLLMPRRDAAIEARLSFRPEIENAPIRERRKLLLAHVRSEVEAVLRWDPAEPINPRHGFFDLGMDSLQANELRNRLQASLDCALPPTLAFKFPTIAALSDHLAWEILGLADDRFSSTGSVDSRDRSEVDGLVSEADLESSISRELAQLEKLLAG